jgi:hypothetical protein
MMCLLTIANMGVSKPSNRLRGQKQQPRVAIPIVDDISRLLHWYFLLRGLQGRSRFSLLSSVWCMPDYLGLLQAIDLFSNAFIALLPSLISTVFFQALTQCCKNCIHLTILCLKFCWILIGALWLPHLYILLRFQQSSHHWFQNHSVCNMLECHWLLPTIQLPRCLSAASSQKLNSSMCFLMLATFYVKCGYHIVILL